MKYTVPHIKCRLGAWNVITAALGSVAQRSLANLQLELVLGLILMPDGASLASRFNGIVDLQPPPNEPDLHIAIASDRDF